MPTIDEILNSLLSLARTDSAIAEALLDTAKDPQPVSALCKLSTKLGYPLYEMDLISAGEDYYAAMRRSTNGGGENSPLLVGEDDYYELFMESVKKLA